jgi:hypothetical protein
MMTTSGNLRRFSLLLTAGLLAVALLLGGARARSELSGDTVGRIRDADRFFDSLMVATRALSSSEPVRARAALALGYLERLRLGLGSPFRLADFALNDVRLDQTTRERVAWEILARLRRGDAYVVDSRVADGFGPFANGKVEGAQHVALIERAVASASDPRAGELAVRIAYALAAGERTIADRGDLVAIQVAALMRDRLLAQRDLRQLLSDARSRHTDPLMEVTRRRAERELAVEQPAGQPLPEALQVEAMQTAPRLLASIRGLSVQPSPDPEREEGISTRDVTLLGVGVATRLSELGARTPASAAVAVTLRSHRGLLLAGQTSNAMRHARERFVNRSINEETLAGEYGRLLATADTARHDEAMAMLAAATALRSMAQETPWFPGQLSVTASDLRAEFGLTAVRFDDDVPEAWRPYYLRMIASSLTDMQRVLGGLSFDGLSVSVAMGGLPDSVLALHDPRTRTIRMSAFSSAGTIAHELAHDMDWQAARKLYASGGYSTDRAMRERRGPLAASMRDLTSMRLPARRGVEPGPERPAEVFARNVDWLVAIALASEGRSNGFLTSVQDAELTGYTTVSPATMLSGAARPLVNAVQEMTYLSEPVRERFLAEWADARTIDPFLLVRHVLRVPLARARLAPMQRFFGDDDALFATGEAALCSPVSRGDSDVPELRWRQAMLDLALDARARGIARLRARYFADESRPSWARSVIGIPPSSPQEGERVIRRIRNALAMQLDADPAGDQLRFEMPSIFRPNASSCVASDR